MSFFSKLFGRRRDSAKNKEEKKKEASSAPVREEEPADAPASEMETPPVKAAEEAKPTKESLPDSPQVSAEAASEDIGNESVSAGKGMFEVKRASDGRYMFNVRAGNTQVIASSQMYTTMASCKNGIRSVGTNAPIAGIEDQTLSTLNTEKCPKFQIYFDRSGKYRFNLLAANGDNILACTQGYTQKSACKNGINSVIRNAYAPVVIQCDKAKD